MKPARKRLARRVAALGLAFLGVTAVSRPVVGQSPTAAVTLLLFSATDVDRRILAGMTEQVAGLGVQLKVVSVAPPVEDRLSVGMRYLRQSDNRLVFFWEMGSVNRVRFLLKRDGPPRTMTRELTGVGEIAVEDAVILVSLATIELLLDRGDLSQRSSPAAAPLSPETAPTPVAPPRLHLGGAYQVVLGSVVPDVSHQVRGQVAYRFSHIWRMYAGAGVGSRFSSEEDGVTVTALPVPLYWGLAAVSRHSRVRVGGQAGVAFAVLRRTVSTVRNDIAVQPPGWRMEFALEFAVRMEVAIGAHMAITTAWGALVVPSKLVYKIRNGVTLFDEYWNVRPMGSVGLQIRGN